MSIPKKIHFCWLSGEEYPDDIKQCIDSWYKVMPDYQFKLWDKKAFDIDSHIYVRQAVEERKWAFASDYIRLYALYTEGGIYLDSDIEAYRSFDPLLDNEAFIGLESGGRVSAWLLASEAGNPLFGELLEYYSDRQFRDKSGKLDMTPNTIPMTRILVEHGLQNENQYQKLEHITVYPEDYFCPKNPWTGKITITDNTYAMHLFKGAWNDISSGEREFIGGIGARISLFLEKIINRKNEDIYIYGAGTVGKLALEALRMQSPNLTVKNIIVTKRDINWAEMDGVPIVEVDDLILKKERIILIATTPKYQESIKNTLENLGFHNYFLL